MGGSEQRDGGGAVEVLKISSKSKPNTCAGALAGVLRKDGAVEMQVVGAGALNQAIKAVAIARAFVAPSGLDLVCIPAFADIEIDGESRTAIRLVCEDRHRRKPVEFDVRPTDSDALPRMSDVAPRINDPSHMAAVTAAGAAYDVGG